MTMSQSFIDKAVENGCRPYSKIGELTELETDTYQKIRRMHCAENKGSHACIGTMKIDARGMTLSCNRCGDIRRLNKK